MISTLRPRGWVYPSIFQQTVEYQEFVYEESDYTDGEILVPGSDSELSSSGRATKRRKIERLATGFLKGEELIISTARPSATSVRQACERLVKHASSQLELPEPVDLRSSSPAKWEDVDDDLEVMRKHSLTVQSVHVIQSRKARSRSSTRSSKTITEETVRSHFKPKAGRRGPRLLRSGPSDEALAQAAMLRNRKTALSANNVPNQPTLLPVDRTSPEACSDTESAPLRSDPPGELSDEETSVSTPPCCDDEEDDREDDSCHPRDKYNESPISKSMANYVQSKLNLAIDDEALSMAVHETINSPNTLVHAPDKHEALSRDATVASPPMEHDASYCTAPDATESGLPKVENGPQQESQAGLLRTILAAPPKSWTPMNELIGEDNHEPKRTATRNDTQDPPTSFEFRHLVHSSAQMAGKAKTRRTRTTTKTSAKPAAQTTRRRTAPSESQHARQEMADLPVDQQRRMSNFRIEPKPTYTASTQSGNTPFMYRKRSKETVGEKALQVDPTTPSTVYQQTAQVPPVLDMSFGHESSFAQGLNKALVEDAEYDNYLNKKIPNDPSSKKKLLQEMRKSGADITQTPSQCDPPQTTQARGYTVQGSKYTPSGDMPEHDENFNEAKMQTLVVDNWEGTQNLLMKAQRGLFSSPHKPVPTQKPAPQLHISKKGTPQTAHRGPLHQLSQEQVATVQNESSELITWSPWSAVKGLKPDQSENMLGAPPSFGFNGAQDSSDSIAARLAVQSDNANHESIRRSSLRLSTTVTDSPAKQTALSFSIRKSQCSVDSDVSGTKTALQTYHVPGSNGEEETLYPTMQTPAPSITMSRLSMPGQPSSFAAGPPLPSYEAAQLPMDISDLSANIDDLTRDALDITDMDGIMSQASIVT